MKYTDAWSRALPPVQAKQSMCVKPKPSTSPAYEKAKEIIFLFAKKKRKDKMDTTLSWKPPLDSPGFLIMKQTFLYKHDGTAFAEIFATCYSLCDTNILHYVLRHFRYWTPLSRPSLTHRLITWFLYIYKIFKKQFISLHIRLLKYPHALKEEEEKKRKRKCGLLVKSIISFHCGLQVKKTQVKATREFSGKQI